MWYVQEVGMLFPKKVLEESVDVHCSHPSFQSDRVLLYLLDRLAFGHIGRLDAQVLSKLTPCLDLFSIELDDELPQSISFKLLVVAPRRSVELRPKRGRFNVQIKVRVTV